MTVPAGATVMRLHEQSDGTIEIVFEDGAPRDYIWSSWSKSNWKSIDWLLGKVPDDQYGIIEGAKPTTRRVVVEKNETKGTCIWRKAGFSLYPDCRERIDKSINWMPGIVKHFAYCPYCGRRIKTAST